MRIGSEETGGTPSKKPLMEKNRILSRPIYPPRGLTKRGKPVL